MMFIKENYKSYKYVVDISDNYLVLAKQSSVNASWDNPRSIDVVYQYLNPSFLTVEATRTFTSNTVFSEVDETSQSFFARADCNDIISSQFLVIFFVVFVLNALTRFVKKGGVFFGQ